MHNKFFMGFLIIKIEVMMGFYLFLVHICLYFTLVWNNAY